MQSPGGTRGQKGSGRPTAAVANHRYHALPLPNEQDGVPYLVQPPVRPGESFVYRFTPPDIGTYFFHTHCNTVEQLDRGLMGILLIDGDTTEPYDADKVLLIRDWAIDVDSGEFTSFFTLRGAGRAGTYGSLRSINGAVNPEIALPAAGGLPPRAGHPRPPARGPIPHRGCPSS